MNGYFAQDDDFDDWYPDDEWDEMEEAIHECGQLPEHLGGGCQLAGTEYCDFECPFRDSPHPMIDEDDE